MIHVTPDMTNLSLRTFDSWGRAEATQLTGAILAAVLSVPRFPSVVLPITVVFHHSGLVHFLYTMSCPTWPERTLGDSLLTTYAMLGLVAFEADGEGDEGMREAAADRELVELLRKHPDAILRDGSKAVVFPEGWSKPSSDRSDP